MCRERLGDKVYVTTSHEILPVSGEYERFSTTVVSAYIGPIVSKYLLALEKWLSQHGLQGQPDDGALRRSGSVGGALAPPGRHPDQLGPRRGADCGAFLRPPDGLTTT